MMDVKDANDDLEQPQQKLMSSSSPKSLSTSLTALSVASRTRSEGSISGGSESNRDSIDSSFPFSESFSPPSDSFLNTLDLGVSFGGDSPPINSPSASLRSSRSSSVGDGACGTLHPTIVTPLDQNRKLYSSPPKLSNTCKINPSVSYSKTQSSTVSHNFAPYSVPVYSKLPTGHYQRHPQVTPYGPYSFPPGYQRVGTRQMDSSGRMISNIEQRFPRPPIAYRQNHQMSSVGGRVVHPSMIGSRGHGPSSANVMGSYSGGPAHFSRRPVNDSRPYSYVSSRSYERLDEFLKPRPQHSRDFVPKFYKSVIDDVVNNIREIFLDDGVDEQVIQDLRTIWERKITDTRAIEHATNNNSNTNSNNTSNSKSKSNHAKQAAAAATAAVNQSQSAAGAHTSVITSNPNHMKNGPSSNTNNNNNNSTVRVKDEIIEEEQQQHHSQQQHQATARRPVAVTTQPQLTTMVQPASPMVTTNGNLIHHPNLAQQVAPSTNILRASAIVSNPSGPASLPAGLTAAPNSGHLIQVLQQPNSALRTQNYSTQAQPQAAAQPSAPSTSGQISSNRQSAIYTIIPSPSSSFSPVIVSSSGGQTAATSSSTFTTNHYKSGGGNSVGTFTPKIVVPKVTGVGGGSGQVPHTTAEHLTNMNNVQQNRIVSIAPHGHKKRILNSINTDRNNGLNGSVVSGASFGGGNLASLADVAVSHTNQNTHLLNSMNLARQHQAAQRLHLGNLNATAPAGANLATAAGHRGLITHAALQSMAAPNNNNHQQQHIILGPGSAGSGVPGKQQEPMKFQTIIGGQKVMILPNNAGGQYVMTAPSTQFVLTPEILNQINLSGGILTTGPNGQPTVLHRAPASALGASTIQYATAPGIQQVRTVAAPGLMQQLTAAQPQLGQPGAANATNTRVAQLDGLGDSSSEDEDEDDYRDNDDDQDDNDDEMNDEENDGGIEDEEPLNSGDDVSEEDPNELFDTDNVVVCQYDKITRSRNKWKFHFKDGIMNLQGKDYVFQKAVGDAEW